MLDHIHDMDNRLERVCKALQAADSRFADVHVPPLEVPEFESDGSQETGGDADHDQS